MYRWKSFQSKYLLHVVIFFYGFKKRKVHAKLKPCNVSFDGYIKHFHIYTSPNVKIEEENIIEIKHNEI